MGKKGISKYQKEYTNARNRILYRKRRAQKQGYDFNIEIPKTYTQLKKEGFTRKEFLKESKNIIRQSKKIDIEYKQQRKEGDEFLDLSTIDILSTLLNEIPDYIQGYTGRGKPWFIESTSIRDNLLNTIYDNVTESEDNGRLNQLIQYYQSITNSVQEKITDLKVKPPSDQSQAEITLVHIATLIKGAPLTHAENEWLTDESEFL